MCDTASSGSEEGAMQTETRREQSECVLMTVDDTPPRRSSLLLCPSQWSALLEAAPVSLVVREMREGAMAAGREMEEEDEEEREGDLVPRLVFAEEDEIRTPLGGRTPNAGRPSSSPCVHYTRPEECERLLERLEDVALDMESSPSYLPPSPPSFLAPPPPSFITVDFSPDNSHLTSSHLTPSLITPSLITPSLITPSQSALDLELTIDERLPQQQATPPDHRSHVSWSDTSRMSHSRNISETPSLPPFHSSSTSSAYHSRNSSLGSQLSSCCFESDSMLSQQFTDIDSCLSVRIGSHGDLKTPPRFSCHSDASPCHGSELSVSTQFSSRHLPSPLLQNRLKGICLSPSLEETLCHGGRYVIESLEEKQRGLHFKSNEWIKRQLEKGRDSIVQVKVSSKSKHIVHFNVKSGDIIVWEFATKKRDIGFGVLFEATEVATEQEPVLSSHESIEKKVTSILPLFRVGTHSHPTIGFHCATQDGVYEIYFDNSYSRFFAKELYYRITTQSSEPNINYLQQ